VAADRADFGKLEPSEKLKISWIRQALERGNGKVEGDREAWIAPRLRG